VPRSLRSLANYNEKRFILWNIHSVQL